MNDVVMAFGDNAAMIVTGCFLLVVAVLCALIVHDTWARREQLVRMREEDEIMRQRSKYIREHNKFDKDDFSRFCQQRNQQNAAISNIERLKRPRYPSDAKNDTDRLMADGWPLS